MNSTPAHSHLSDSQAFAYIVAHGLSIRQIPHSTTHLYEMHHHVEGRETVRQKLDLSRFGPKHYDCLKARAQDPRNWVFDDEKREVWRVYTKEVRIPKYPGYWMVRQVQDTSSRVEWSYKHHHLAPTLAESVALFVASLTKAAE